MRFFVAIALCALVVSGCGGVESEVEPPLEPVTGTVTLDGEPAAGVAVTFAPGEGTSGNGASGMTDASGKFTLNYRTGSPGIPAGEYVALFSKLTQEDGSPIPEGQTAADVMARDQIPERYRSTDNRQMRASVPAGGKSFDFKLTTK